MKMTVSFSKGKKSETSIKHNNRSLEKDFDYTKKGHTHIKQQYTSQNRVLKHESIRNSYKKLFGEAVDEYNKKQKRKDRKIKDFYQHIKKSGKQQTQFEFIAQVGNKDDFEGLDRLDPQGRWQQAADLLQEYEAGFEKRHPQMHVYNATIHMDEEGAPHLHMNLVPVATGYKRGVAVQPSLKRVLSQEGYEVDPKDSRAQFNAFREQEQQALAKLLQDRGVGRKAGITNKLKDIHEYKEAMRQIEDAQTQAEQAKDSAKKARLEAGRQIAEANEEAKKAKKSSREQVKKQLLALKEGAREDKSRPSDYIVTKKTAFGRDTVDREATEKRIAGLLETAKKAQYADHWLDDRYESTAEAFSAGYNKAIEEERHKDPTADPRDSDIERVKALQAQVAQQQEQLETQKKTLEKQKKALDAWQEWQEALKRWAGERWEALQRGVEQTLQRMHQEAVERRREAQRDRSR